jgi:probable phosphoglycerate mutase
MLTLHLVRHGNTVQNTDGGFCGDIDPPLTERGKLQADRLARAVQPFALDAIFCSPKIRARMTAEPIARACGLGVVIDDGLKELSYGVWEDRKEGDVAATDGDLFEAWRRDPALMSPPGGESAFAVVARSMPVLLRILGQYRTGRVLVVSHKATIRIMVCALLGIPVGAFRGQIGCPNASITSFEFGERGPRLVRVGDVHHLE